MMAGYCWPWSDPKDDGTLVNDVVVGEYARPWNAKPDAGRLAKGIPKSNLWAYQPGGIDQIGCVYTAQGFEFDYAGVIFGNDLRYDLARGMLGCCPPKDYFQDRGNVVNVISRIKSQSMWVFIFQASQMCSIFRY